MANSLFYGKGIDGKLYGFKASDTAYPADILSVVGFTKLAADATLPTTVTLLPNNQIKGYFARIYARLANNKTRSKFIAADKASAANALLGKTLGSSKVIAVKFTA